MRKRANERSRQLAREMSWEISPFTVEDCAEALFFWQACEGIVLGSGDSLPDLRAFLTRNPGLSFVAKDQGRLLGTVLAGHDRRRGYIYHLAVHPEGRRKGLGRTLVNLSVEALQKAGIRKCHLFVFKENEVGLAFWKALGWKERTELAMMSKGIAEPTDEADKKKDLCLGSRRGKGGRDRTRPALDRGGLGQGAEDL